MKELRRLVVVVPAVALVTLLVMLFLDRGAVEQLAFLRRGQSVEGGLVDQRPYQTAQTLAGLAVSAEEQNYAQEAERLADHEVDQAFAMALRKSEAQPKTLTGEALALSQKVDGLKATLKADEATVATLTAAAKMSGTVPSPGDDLDVAQAQLGLDQDELNDAQASLARATGDRRAEIQQELTARGAAIKTAGGADVKKTAVQATRQFATLLGRGEAWFAQRNRVTLLVQAEDEAKQDGAKLQQQQVEYERAYADEKNAGAAGARLAGSDRVQLLKTLSARRVLLSTLDDRLQTDEQLARVYERWQAQVWVQHRIVAYLLLQSFAWLALVLLLAALAAMLARMVVARACPEVRRRRTLDTIVVLTAEVFAAIGAALIVFGTPQQMPTILGLATAGVTVVFQDFILGFFGWFSLMGKHGIRVGDWVEINSVSGEVAGISLFRTVLLETGNWTTQGHPTGRRMTFSNSFALKGQFFNFSTNGQWMWDEVSMNVPATANAYGLIQQAQTAVEEQTSADTKAAEAEWQHVASELGLGQFNAKPAVELRPAAAGVDLVVRFVTRASERFKIRNKINQALLSLMKSKEASVRPIDADKVTATSA